MSTALLFIPIATAAAALQTARNALQRGLLEEAGPWGATLVRFLFGLPFAVVWFLLVSALSAPHGVTLSATFFVACAAGAAAQTFATASLLVAMRRSSFAIGSTFQQTRLPLSALVGVVLGDHISAMAWIGIGLASVGLFALSWPKNAKLGQGDWSAAAFGFAAGGLFALSANAFRQASLSCAPGMPWLGAATTLVVVQALQSAALTSWLAWRDRKALTAGIKAWRRSLGAGFTGFAASMLWFTAFGMAPAAAVQAVSVVEIPISAWAGRRLFQERLTLLQILAALAIGVGVVITAVALVGG
jgi:drug/metabolite transporter (DMT)-like permease